MSPVRKRSISAWLRLLKFLRSSSTRPTSPQPSLPEQNSVSSRGPQHHRSQTPLSTPQASSSTSPSRTRSIASRPRASRPLQPSSTPPTSPQWHFTERDASSALETQRDRSKIQYTPLPSRPLSPARAHLIASRSLSHAQRLPQSLPIQHPSPQLPPLEQTSPRNASRKWGKLPYVHTVATSEALWANVQERHRLALDVLFGRITEAAERYRDQYIRLGEFEKFLSCQSGIDVLTNFTGDKATPYVELLDELIFLTDDANLRSRYLEILRKLCSTCGSFPKSFHISSGSLRKTGNRPEALGGFSDIWKGEYCGREVAIKVLRGYDSGEASCEDIQALVKEVLVWKHLKHKNITPFIGLDTDLFRLSLVCTWMPYGTIKAYLQAHPTSNRLVLLLHVAEGLRYLHEMNVLHGDLKSANILINEHHVACLADFGLTTLCHQGKLTTLSVTACSPRWTAPEILDPERFGLMRAQSTVASDVYSFAMVAWEVFTGLLPFHDCSHIGSISWRIQTGVRPERPTADALELGLTDEVWDLMEQCWQAEPRVRPGVDEIQACLEEAVTDATSDLPTIPPQRSRAPSRRNRKNPLLSDLVAIGDEVWPPPEEDTFPEDML
ncbi:hypothetical protein CERSUDRAFT_65939 [Gelatoporia subvermispora B]|uniref:Protein kinase domain-containing protein n=1 Tax=Ceriporiopsis subvermispora (strain B) TaxID=914234 RepID=M2RBP7_CERS8|nr:hypothetical protein CERSUDRAFT_65939 [Gelatoporia subvermispora B]